MRPYRVGPNHIGRGAEVSVAIPCFKVSAETLGEQNERDFLFGESETI